MKKLKNIAIFFIWLIKNAKYSPSRKLWIAQGFRRMDARIFRKYGQTVILCSDDTSFDFFHELGHAVMGHHLDVVVERHIDYELAADDFAANILGPSRCLAYMRVVLKEAQVRNLDVPEWECRMNRMRKLPPNCLLTQPPSYLQGRAR